MQKDPAIDTIILGCTHFPLLMPKIRKYVSPDVRIVPQGDYVAESLKLYLERHTNLERRLTKSGNIQYYTTESPEKFKESASVFLHTNINVEHINLE